MFHSARQSCAGMICLTAKKIVHRDLALRNIMVSHGNDRDRFVAKVGDMGLAMDGSQDEESNDTALPIRWAAPECYLKKEFTSASDVWSFGIVLYELFTFGEIPYKGMSNSQVMEKVPEGFRLSRPENCPENVYYLMQSCWEIGGNICF
jgi:serine/threonine protein kinase